MNKVKVIKKNRYLMLADKDGVPLSAQTKLKIKNDADCSGFTRVVVEFIFDTETFQIEEITD